MQTYLHISSSGLKVFSIECPFTEKHCTKGLEETYTRTHKKSNVYILFENFRISSLIIIAPFFSLICHISVCLVLFYKKKRNPSSEAEIPLDVIRPFSIFYFALSLVRLKIFCSRCLTLQTHFTYIIVAVFFNNSDAILRYVGTHSCFSSRIKSLESCMNIICGSGYGLPQVFSWCSACYFII